MLAPPAAERRLSSQTHSPLALLIGVCVLLLCCGCEGCQRTEGAAAAPVATAAKPGPHRIQPPENLIAELVIPQPQASWSHVRAGLGPTAALLPAKYPLLLAKLLAASPVLSGRFLPDLPAVGALAGDAQQVDWVIGFRVHSGAELVAELTTGSDAPFKAESLERVVLLNHAGEHAFGVANNHLFVASRRDALVSLAAYASQIVPRAEQTSAAAVVTFRHHFGEFLRERLTLVSKSWLDTLAQQLSEQKQRQGSASNGRPDLLMRNLEQLVQTVSTDVASIRAGRLELTIDAQEIELKGDFEMSELPEASAEPCAALGQLPASTSSFLLLASMAGGQDAELAGGHWSDVLLPENVNEQQRQRLRDGLSKVAGPLLFGIADSVPFLSFDTTANLAELEQLVRAMNELPLARRAFPSILGGPLLIKSRSAQVVEAKLKSSSRLAPQAGTELAWGKRRGRGWVAAASGSWLRESLEAPEPKTSVQRAELCGRGTLLAGASTVEAGRLRFSLTRAERGLGLWITAPLRTAAAQLDLKAASP